MAHFQVSKSDTRKGWRAEIRRPFVSATVWELIAPDAIYSTAKAARDAIEARYFEGSRMAWQRTMGRGSARWNMAHNGSRHSDAMPVQFLYCKARGTEGECVAIFPTQPGTDPHDVGCYAHIGQHGTASLEWAASQPNATREEFEPLYRELAAIYETGPIEERATLFRVDVRREWMRNARLDAYRASRA